MPFRETSVNFSVGSDKTTELLVSPEGRLPWVYLSTFIHKWLFLNPF